MRDGQTLLLGVSHSMCHLNDVVEFLRQEDIKGRTVMLELAKNGVPSEPQGEEPHFFRKLKDFILIEGGVLIYGDNEEILERTYAKNEELCEQMGRPGISLIEWAELHSENRYVIPHIERDPHFLMMAQEQNPDIVVLGRNHIPYLVENYYSPKAALHRVVYIPKEG